MGFLRPRPKIEEWLAQAAASFRPLGQREYGKLVADWRAHFDHTLETGDFISGRDVEEAANSLFPADTFIFNVPGYRLLPAGTGPKFDQASGYEALKLGCINFEIANPADAVITDRAFTFTCLCTHEAGAFASPQLAPTSLVRRRRIY
jgi:hypothetical protein